MGSILLTKMTTRLLLIALLGFLSHLPSTKGHGNLLWPLAWYDANHAGWYWDEHGNNNHIGCGVQDLPDSEYSDVHDGKPPDCFNFWFSNGVKNPHHATITQYMAQEEVTCTGQAGHHGDPDKKFPWNAPGTAPIYGSCGTLGGNPEGCNQDKFGDCCSDHCDSFAFGKNAEEYEWPDAAVTEWRAGSLQEVVWYVGANHAGGYAYRLCKAGEDLTEECFSKNYLEFEGDLQWVNYGMDRKTGKRTEVKALQTTEGTTPSGSMWRANPLVPHMEHHGDSDHGHGHIIDYVKVPEDLERGEYVLSLRWDSKCSPQVWTSCANIIIA